MVKTCVLRRANWRSIPKWFLLNAVRACNCYEPNAAEKLKQMICDDLDNNINEAVKYWAPFVFNTLNVPIDKQEAIIKQR